MELAVVLQGYELLSNTLAWLKTLDSNSLFYARLPEVQLFASDFLLDGEIFKMFGYEALYEAGLLNARHWRDIQKEATLRQLDDIERAVSFNDRSENPHLPLEPKGLLDENFIPELGLAVTEGDLSTVKRLLSRREGLVDAQTLDLSLQFDCLDIFWSLMNHGACINDIYGKSKPLCTAANRGHMHAVHALLASGASINSARKSTPLTGAAAGGHFSIVQYLIQHGAEINGNKDERPIMMAAARGHLDIVKYLVNAGASIDASSRNGKNALLVAITSRYDQIANYLLTRGASPHEKHGKFWPHTYPLYQAVLTSNFAMVEALLVAGADPNGVFMRRKSPLAEAIRSGNYEMVSLLRSQGALAKSADLTSAVRTGNMLLIDTVIELALQIDGSPISLAIHQAKFDIALKLAQNASRISWFQGFKARECHVQVTELIEHGCTMDTSSRDLQILRQIESELALHLKAPTIKLLSPYIQLFREKRLLSISLPRGQLSTLYRPTNRKEDSSFCQQILTRQLQHGFKKLCHRVLAEAGRNQTSHDFVVFASSYDSPGSKFKKGMRTIRQLIGQLVPESLDQIVCCVMLADAMRTAKMREDVEVIDGSFDEFIKDLPRWRFLLASEHEKLLFDEIVLGVWGSQPEPRAFDGDDAMNANLEYLQILLSNLTSETHSLLGETGNDPANDGGHQLSFFRQAGVQSDYIPSDHGGVRHEANKIFGVFEDPGPPEVERNKKQLWNSATLEDTPKSQQSALMLMAGAIFGIILAFLVGKSDSVRHVGT
jgi:ankyrin repeat protein